MRITRALCGVSCLLWSAVLSAAAPTDDAALAAWRTNVVVRPVSPSADRHTIHSYFGISPESPDGSRVLFYASTTTDSHVGQVCVVDRASGKETVIARDISTEDAHRAACQQWISGGRRVVFHNVRDGQWSVSVVDLDSLQQRVLVRDRQLGWGAPAGDVAPLYGCHWNPGEHRDLELVNVETGAVGAAVTVAAVCSDHQAVVKKLFGDKTLSIFFPQVSPDGRRVFFKLSAGAGGDNFRSSKASFRAGLFCYSLDDAKPLLAQTRWGHPAWHPDSRTIIEGGNLLIDSAGGGERKLPGLPHFSGAPHPTVSPDGKLFALDTTLESLGGKRGEWGVVVGSMEGRDYVIVHRFDQSGGARSWRRSHPHPAFSADGKRIYFNVSSGPWTRLYAAEIAAAKR